ncbi:MAG: hypothetical protein J6V72_03785 [Kiritimatiellae bacterium]|nr:hypothetical protein [Kiritimatiellia bacterium]
MSITDELRRYISGPAKSGISHICEKAINNIADRIDSEHEAKVSYWQGASYKDGYDEGLASADDWLADLTVGMEPMTEENMAGHGWVKLPVGADGEYIRVGERVQLIGNDPGTVSHMSLADDGWRVYVKYDGGLGTGSGNPKSIRHVQPDSWESIIDDACDMAARCCDDDAGKAELVVRCKRLAGEGA